MQTESREIPAAAAGRTTFTVDVRLFAAARERAGVETLSVTLPEGAMFGDLRRTLGGLCPNLDPLLPHLFFAEGIEYRGDDDALVADRIVSAFPPVSGG